MDKNYKFPDGFLWGTSTSAYQIEGGIKNDWSEWESSPRRMKKIEKKSLDKSKYVCGSACDSWNRFPEDFKLAKNMNNNAIRFGIEWARIEPQMDVLDIGAVNHYKKILDEAKNNNLKVALTLWHWTNPLWIAEMGGWSNKLVVERFLRYVKLIIAEFGGYIDYWVVLNEPMVHVSNGYLSGKFPPNRKNPFKARRAFNNLIKAYKESYKLIHEHYPEAQVGYTALVNDFKPLQKWNPLDVLVAGMSHYFWNHAFLRKTKKSMDYVGVDYYFHDRMTFLPPFKLNKNKRVTDVGWEIYPRGIYHVLKYLQSFKKPIIILENGLADEGDRYRADFIRDHLKYVHRAMSGGADVRGYFHWSLIDNYEWAHGYAPKFGLHSVDRETFERTPRPSASVYAEICKNNGF